MSELLYGLALKILCLVLVITAVTCLVSLVIAVFYAVVMFWKYWTFAIALAFVFGMSFFSVLAKLDEGSFF